MCGYALHLGVRYSTPARKETHSARACPHVCVPPEVLESLTVGLLCTRSLSQSQKLQHAKTLSEQLDALSDRSKGEIAGLRDAVRNHELAKVEAEARQAKAERELGTAEARIHVLERAVTTTFSHADGGNPDLDMRLVVRASCSVPCRLEPAL